MSDDEAQQLDAFASPGSLLKAARLAQELSEREVADRLHLMPAYPGIIERDEFQALLHPAFARGYVKAYGKLLGVDEQKLLAAFDKVQAAQASPPAGARKVRSRPVQLQHTGLGVVVGLFLLGLLVIAIWWWRGEPSAAGRGALSQAPATARYPDFSGQVNHEN